MSYRDRSSALAGVILEAVEILPDNLPLMHPREVALEFIIRIQTVIKFSLEFRLQAVFVFLLCSRILKVDLFPTFFHSGPVVELLTGGVLVIIAISNLEGRCSHGKEEGCVCKLHFFVFFFRRVRDLDLVCLFDYKFQRSLRYLKP